MLRIACEDDDKVIEREEERVFYGRLKDVEQLKNADSMEQQEQYEVKAYTITNCCAVAGLGGKGNRWKFCLLYR